MNRATVLMIGAASVLGLTWIWHSPLGNGNRLAANLEHAARAQLDHDEMVRVQARMERDPLTRRLILSGPADDFQRAEIRRRMKLIPGVGDAIWDPASLESETAS